MNPPQRDLLTWRRLPETVSRNPTRFLAPLVRYPQAETGGGASIGGLARIRPNVRASIG